MRALEINHIIVQAGGKGARLEHLTANKPKALVPVENLPILFHLFRRFPEKRYIVIADYKSDVLREYLAAFAEVKFLVTDAAGEGTCAGLGQAAALLPEGAPFMLIWSDLILPENFAISEKPGSYIGISQTFPCRWSYRDGEFAEERSTENGVAGLFIFENKTVLETAPESGEFVRHLKSRQMKFTELGLAGAREIGLLADYEALGAEKCRPFNKITIDGDTVVKEALDEQGRRLARLERAWYERAAAGGAGAIPKIYATEPLTMERVAGKNIYEYTDLTTAEKRDILRGVTDALKRLHDLGRVPADPFSLKEAYYGKTMARLSKIRDLVPLADQKSIVVNGRECPNIYFYRRDLERKLDALRCDGFAFIHGDCTFSNIMLRGGREPVFIDPRGYFGHAELYGDPSYDWAKLYYSIAGNYDRFNLKDFRLTIGAGSVNLTIESNRWENMESEFFALTGAEEKAIKLLHAIIWLSLTTYAWQDCDSVCGAFYNGLYHLEEALR
ncbi:MAG: phosphotransferase [Gracilibacteraceae bacterium]|nr:phosphotransferase [Gracilibacteraceae bacterium]